tara:strand:- start:498 stop:1172 length:675 start_codon:yes stop_codon:yes gene_type:complete
MIKKLLKRLRDLVVGDFRSKILSDLIVNKIIKYNKQKNIKILDYGSGFQPNVIYFVYNKLTKVYKKKVVVDCYDFYTLKQLAELNKKKKLPINFYQINAIKSNKNKYDFATINDVLHHIGIENEVFIKNLLNNLIAKTKIIFIKDHFQQGFVSNQTIRLMDFLGNYFNDVPIPKLYYTKKTFEDLIKKTNGSISEIILEIKLYPAYLLFLSNPKFNFACLIKKR